MMIYFFQFKPAHIGESLGSEPQAESYHQNHNHIPHRGPGIGFNPFVLKRILIFKPFGLFYLNWHYYLDEFILQNGPFLFL